MKNVLILSSSPRVNGNSDLLCSQFAKGAKEAGHQVEIVHLNNKKIHPCYGCYSCDNSGACFQKDDMAELLPKMLEADVIVFASPVYFYSMSGQLKVFIDRLVPIYTQVRADIYIFVTAYDSNKRNLESTVEAIRGLTRDCFEECEEKGVLMAGGVDERGEIKAKPEFMKAYDMGKNC